LSVPAIKLNNGIEIPALGFGVFQTPPDETTAAVEEALRVGYRHIDTAAGYANERGVGEGIRRSGLRRDEVFVETKIWITDYGYEETLHGFDKSARKLGLEQIDLLILHQPLTADFERTLGAYRALETLLADGTVRAIGISNFMPEDIEKLAARRSCRRSTRSSCIPTSSSPRCSASTSTTASSRRRGRRWVELPSIDPASPRARSMSR
jgi:diketogulonate reductase-like aldo/keto reductase